MDKELAETYLRHAAEAELRHAGSAHLPEITRALTAVGAVDAAVAEAITTGFELAMWARQPGPAQHGPSRRAARRVRPAETSRPPVRVAVPVGLRIPAQYGAASAEVLVLAYLCSSSGARFAIHGQGTDDGDPGLWLRQAGLIISDDTGAPSTGLYFLGEGSGGEWNGELWLDRAPAPGARWLSIDVPGQPARRVSLAESPATAITGTTVAPGERYLHGFAGLLLCGHQPAPGMNAVVKALTAVGALAPDSSVPGQLAGLCARLGLPGHGIEAAPADELPERWESVLASEPRAAGVRGGAAAAARLQEVDGDAVTLLGLHDDGAHTGLHVHATESLPPQLWVRDDEGGWHVADGSGWRRASGDPTSSLILTPPLRRPAWVDVLAAGKSAETGARVSLRWA